MRSAGYCAECGAALSPLWRYGRCPACRQGVRRESAAEALARAEALLGRVREEGHPELGRIAAATRARVEQLRAREAEERRNRSGGEGDQKAG